VVDELPFSFQSMGLLFLLNNACFRIIGLDSVWHNRVGTS
jgi:hypothetical protein